MLARLGVVLSPVQQQNPLEMDRRDSGHLYSQAGLYCTLCGHDLDHSTYLVCEHPCVRTPLCVLCRDEIESRLGEAGVPLPGDDLYEGGGLSYDVCTWCGLGGDLIVCGDGDSCPHSFCRGCLETHLGDEVVGEINAADEWKCLVCCAASPRNQQMRDFAAALETARLDSMYTKGGGDDDMQSVEDEGDDDKSDDDEDEDEERVATKDCVIKERAAKKNLDLLHTVLMAIEEALVRLEEKSLSEKRKLVADELCLAYGATQVNDEMDLYEAHWQRHLEILQRQEVDLIEIVTQLGFDPFSLPTYTDIGFGRDEEAMDEEERESAKEVTRMLNERDQREKAHQMSSPGDNSVFPRYARDHDWFAEPEAHRENPRADLASLAADTATDPRVQRYHAQPPLHPTFCPPSFYDAWPSDLVKALHYSSRLLHDQPTFEALVDTYKVPPHVQVVLKHWCGRSGIEVPEHAKRWTFARSLHGSILKALYYTELPKDHQVLQERYGLEEDVAEVCDVGEIGQIVAQKHPGRRHRVEVDFAVELANCLHEENQHKSSRLFSTRQLRKIRQEDAFEEEDDEEEEEDRILRSLVRSANKATRAVLRKKVASITRRKVMRGRLPAKKQQGFITASGSTVSENDGGELPLTAPLSAYSPSGPDKKRRKASSGAEIDYSPDEAGDDDFEEVVEKTMAKPRASGDLPQHKAAHPDPEPDDNDVIDLTGEVTGDGGESFDTLIEAEKKEAKKQEEKRRKAQQAPSSSKENSRDGHPDQTNKRQTTLGDCFKGSGTKSGSSASLFSTVTKSPFSQSPANSKADLKTLSSLFPDPKDARLQDTESDAFADQVFCLNDPAFAQKAFQHPQLGGWGTEPRDVPVLMLKDLVRHLKSHQREGLCFLWKNTIARLDTKGRDMGLDEALKGGNTSRSKGCIIAHCMGLGKTFTIVAFTFTLLCSPQLCLPLSEPKAAARRGGEDEADDDNDDDDGGARMTSTVSISSAPLRRLVSKILIIVPINTIENWGSEFKKWAKLLGQQMEKVVNRVMSVQLLVSGDKEETKRKKLTAPTEQRLQKLRKWSTEGGVMIIGYELFTRMVAYPKRSQTDTKGASKEVAEARLLLCDPGPDMVVCDEIHLVKDKSGQNSRAINNIRTNRRIGLTGSPLQNNLLEYHAMMTFVRPNYLSSEKIFKEQFVIPITNGQSNDASKADVRKMKQRSYVLHKKLQVIVHRRDLSVLSKDLPPKRLFVVSLRMSPLQTFLYRVFLDKVARKAKGRSVLFLAYQTLLKVWNHPAALVLETVESEGKEARKRKKSGGDRPKAPSVDMKQLIRELDPVRLVCQQKGARILGTCRQVEEIDPAEEEEEEEEDEEGEGDDDSLSMTLTVADEETEDEDDQEEGGDDYAQQEKDDQSSISTKGGSMDVDPSSAVEGDAVVEKDWWRMKVSPRIYDTCIHTPTTYPLYPPPPPLTHRSPPLHPLSARDTYAHKSTT